GKNAMQFGKSQLFTGIQQVQPKSQRVLSAADADISLAQRQKARAAGATLQPCHLVHRNYLWLLVDGPGIVEKEFDYDDFFFPTPPKFEFLTVCLMGSNVTFADQQGRPAPFPQALTWINCGEIPLSHRFWIQLGFLDPFLDPGAGTVQ